jgi:predicted Zn-dependent peptidase
MTKQASNWWFGAQVSQKNAPALFEIMIKELEHVFAGRIDAADIEAAKAYSLGRFQRSAQTVGGTASGYTGRYFFDEVVEDYYQVPKRIRAITKTSIVDIARDMFADDIWGLGILSNCEREVATQLYDQFKVLWTDKK